MPKHSFDFVDLLSARLFFIAIGIRDAVMLLAFGTLSVVELLAGPTAIVSLLGLAFAAYRLGRVPVALSPIFAGSWLIVLLWLACSEAFSRSLLEAFIYWGFSVHCSPSAFRARRASRHVLR